MKYKLSIYNNIFSFESKKYLYNSHSGAFFSMDSDLDYYLTHIGNTENVETNSAFTFLREKGIIVPQCLDEFGQFRMRGLYNQFDTHPRQISFVILTTTACNYRCFYCYQDGVQGQHMTTETQNAVIKFVCQSIDNTGCASIRITWFGGEPLLNQACIEHISEQIIPYCHERSIEYSASIISNGSLIDKSFIDKFQAYHIQNIQITVDGTAPTYCVYKGSSHKDYCAVAKNLLSLSQVTCLDIRLNTDGENYPQIKSFVKEIIAAGICIPNTNFYLAKIYDSSWKNNKVFSDLQIDFLSFLFQNELYKNIFAYLPKSKYISCGLMQQCSAVIDVDGALLRCEHYVGNCDEVIGTVFEGRFFNDGDYKFIDDPIPKRCKVCSMYPICRRGCAQLRIDKKTSDNCLAFKNFVEKTLLYISKSLRQSGK
jgi:uncharacterized protein